MERIQDLRNVTPPDGRLAWRDVRSQLVSVPTGKFTRNCVLTGKSSPDMDFPLYIRTPGLISPLSGLSPEGFGYFDASEGTAVNVFPKHNAISADSDYWAASSLGCWIAYHHELRPTMLRGYRFITYNGYTPRIWRVEGSNDNATWTTLHSVTVDWTWGDGKQVVEQEIPLENRDYFMHHRLIVDEFDATSIRIYYLQFWDALCPSNVDFYLDADAENPCQLAFANGYNTDGSPKDILFTINTGIPIDATAITEGEAPENTPMPCTLFAKYDSSTSSVSFLAEVQYAGNYIDPYARNIRVVSYSAPENPENILDGSSSTKLSLALVGGNAVFEFPDPVYISKYYINASGTFYFEISEDYGATWNTWTVSGTGYHTLDRIYAMTRFRVRRISSNASVYYVKFYDASPITLHKMSNGEIYEYDPITEQWNKTYKLPLGYFSLWRNPEGTAFEIGPFTPTHIPQMAIAPWFRKTSGGLAL